MREVIAHAPGTVCWVELGTTDIAAARSFYEALFGWSSIEAPMPDGTTYTMLQHDGHDAGGVYHLNDEQQANHVPPHWMLYTAVEDADATTKAVQSNGGTVIVEPLKRCGDRGRRTRIRAVSYPLASTAGSRLGSMAGRKYVPARQGVTQFRHSHSLPG